MTDVFNQHYQNNYWGDDESVSGPGSNLQTTEGIRRVLPQLFAQLGIKSLLDIPCGDFNWMAAVINPLVLKYIGADSVPALIDEVRSKNYGYDFRVLDARTDLLPQVDMIFCRDLLVHLSWGEANLVLKNFRASGSKYLLATTFPGAEDFNIETGMWRPIDMARFRYMAHEPELLIPDGKWGNKSLGLWRLA